MQVILIFWQIEDKPVEFCRTQNIYRMREKNQKRALINRWQTVCVIEREKEQQ